MTNLNLHAIIIKYLLLDIYYSKYYNIILNNNKNNKYIYRLLLVIDNLYKKYNKTNYSVDELEVFFNASYPVLHNDDAEYYSTLFQAIKQSQVDEAIADDLFKKFLEQALAEQIALTAIQVSQGQKDFSAIAGMLESVPNEPVEDYEQLTTTSIKEIHSAKESAPGLSWRLGFLNKSVGPLRRGNFGFIFARPETGKTSFLASEVTHMASETDGCILWVNNEQPGPDVVWRCYNALLGMDSNSLSANLDEAESSWNKSIGDRLKFVDNPSITKTQIEQICKRYNPSLILFDQLDKVHGFDAERYDLLMKAKYQWARELSKIYGPVIGVCQAGGSAENKRYLEMNDIDSSHTAKQGEADWILGIGKINDAGYERVRYLSICKNKLPGGEQTDQGLRHGKMEVLINEETSRYEDKIRW